MKTLVGLFAFVCVFTLTVGTAVPDTIYLKGGEKFEGKLVTETPTAYYFTVKGLGLQKIARADVLKVEVSHTALYTYTSKAARLSAGDKDQANRHYELGLWCRREGLSRQARAQFELAIAIDPDHAGARAALGYVRSRGKWVLGKKKAPRLGGAGFGPQSKRRPGLRAQGAASAAWDPVDMGLRWLAYHQDPHGFWDCDDFMRMCKMTPPCTGPGGALYDPGVTGLALLAFLGAGNTESHGPYQNVVRSGLAYLKGIQDAEGCFGPRIAQRYMYNTAIATEAVAEAYGAGHSPQLEKCAQRGIDFLLKAQNPHLAWRYGVRPQDNDTSVSGWAFMALMAGKRAGLHVPKEAIEGMRAWLDQVTDPQYGVVGYTQRGVGPARPKGSASMFPADKSEALTAVGLLCRILMGESPRKSELLRKETSLLEAHLPVWNESDGSIDMYYWYYGTRAMYRVQGVGWSEWNKAMTSAILDHQVRTGCPKGSWDPVGVWGKEGGRVYSTALMTMCLEFYYRYGAITGEKSR